MQSNLDLKEDKYTPPITLNIFIKCLSAVSIGALIIGLYGDGISKKEVCFYPITARKHDADVRLSGKGKQLFGSRFCKPEHLVIIPTQLEKEQKYQSSNPSINKWARLINQDTYTMQDISADNPYKGIAGLISAASGLALLGANKHLIDYMNSLRPQYRANKQLEGVRSAIALKTQERLLELSAEELIRYWRGLAVAEAKITFIQNLTIQQANLLMTGMSAEEYEQFGHVIDGGQSFSRFSPAVEAPEVRSGEPDRLPPAEQDNTAWVQNLIKQTALIWGNQGGGKSWLARYVVKQKKQAGYKVIVLDPDSNKAEWQGVESYHSWEDIEQQIRDYVEELEKRLKTFNNSSLSEDQWREKLWSEGKATALICEEATTYGDFIKDEELLSKFGKLALTKSRKQEMPLTVVAHNNTQTCLFGIKGLYNLVSKMLQVECLAQVDPITLQPKSTGKAKVKLDSSTEWILVELPTMTAKISDFRVNTVNQNPQTVTEQLAASLKSDPQLLPASKQIIAWLRANRKDTWVKFKGKSERDSSFVNFLSKNNIESDARDEAIKELIRWELVDIRNEGSEIKPTEF